MSAGLGFFVARPGAAWALVLPLVFLLWVRVSARPPEVVIGTLELWEGESESAARGARARARIPAWARACALALLCGALAWLGPRGARAASSSRWTCVVDVSPSMALPSGSETRLELALASASAWLARHAADGERVRWVAAGRAALELGRAERPGPEWLAARSEEHAAEEQAEPEWELHDEPGTLWITDRAPPIARRHAGLFASGGAAVDGPVAADGRETVVWERGALRVSASEPQSALFVREPAGLALPEVLERVLLAWSEARGFALVRGSGAGARLVVELVPDGDRALALARDGWRSAGRGGLTGVPLEAEADWLVGTDASGAPQAVVRARRGHVRVALRELSEPTGDPALFALSWAKLLDASLLRAEGALPLAERLAAGAPRSEPGALPRAPSESAHGLGPGLDSALALCAALCALLALFLRPRV